MPGTHPHRPATLLVAALLLSLAASATAQAPVPAPRPSLEGEVDSTIQPGDDFFGYANGRWLAASTIPAGMERWSARTEIDSVTRGRIAWLITHGATAPAGSLARKVADFRAAWLDASAIERHGLAPLRPALDSIDRLHDAAGLTRALGRDVGSDADPLNWGVYRSSHILGVAVEISIHGESHYVPLLVQGGLGLPDRESYLSAEPRMQALRESYRTYIAGLLTLAGLPEGARRAEQVLALETAMAERQTTREASASDHRADTLWTRADFMREAPGMDWGAFLDAAGLGKATAIVPWQPSAMTGLASLVASQPLPVWKDYLRFHLLDRYADLLPHGYGEQAALLRGVTGQWAEARGDRALAATQLWMSDALGRLYAERYFPAEQKARVLGIVTKVGEAFQRRVEASSWMAPETKRIALAKLKVLYVGIGYPERWPDDADLRIDPDDALGNLRRIEQRKLRRTLARIGQPVDRSEWWIAPQRVNAILAFQQNAYQFSAALLQAPKFDPAASDPANYGAIGAVIGHDISHFVDVLGAEYGADGALRRYWTAADSARYQALVAPLVAQYSGYRPFPDLALNGTLTATENIADLAGLTAAFDAYRQSVAAAAPGRDALRRMDREFFLGFARAWRSTIRPEVLRTQVESNDHAPERYRVSTVRNLDAWYDAFDVRPGQQLYLPPEARVRIW